MQCSCGAETKDHDSVEDGKVVARRAQCVSCGRVMFWHDNRNQLSVEEKPAHTMLDPQSRNR